MLMPGLEIKLEGALINRLSVTVVQLPKLPFSNPILLAHCPLSSPKLNWEIMASMI
jgi:hypothetical protein